MTSWLKTKLGGRFRVSTVVLIVAFIALFWVQQTFQPEPAPEAPVPAVVPPGFVPDPNYTWVPRTQVRRPKEPDYTTTTTTPTTTRPRRRHRRPTTPTPARRHRARRRRWSIRTAPVARSGRRRSSRHPP